MVALVEAYQSGAIRAFERILASHRGAIMGDPFISRYMTDLLANIRTQVGGQEGGWQGRGGGGAPCCSHAPYCRMAAAGSWR